MNRYKYKARTKSGSETTGLIESISETSAVKSLQERDLMVITLVKSNSFDWRKISINFAPKTISEREVTNFTQLLSTMLSTGLPLSEALSNLAAQTQSDSFQEIIRTIQSDIQSGISLSEALNRHPKVFPSLYISLVKAGEASGKVAETLERLADTMEAELDFKGKIQGAMIYPAIVIIAMSSIGIFMMTTIIPKISEVYKEFNAELPLPTKILIGASTAITQYFWLVIIFVFCLITFYKILRKNPVSDYILNNAKLKLPIFGQLTIDVSLSLMCRTLGTLLASGVAIVDALKIVSATLPNDYFRYGLLKTTTSVEKGLPFSLAIKNDPNFPIMVSQLTAIGEETGTLDQSLARLAKFYQDSAERKVKMLTTALEPLTMLLMGLMVGGLAIAVLLPMFNLVNVIK